MDKIQNKFLHIVKKSPREKIDTTKLWGERGYGGVFQNYNKFVLQFVVYIILIVFVNMLNVQMSKEAVIEIEQNILACSEPKKKCICILIVCENIFILRNKSYQLYNNQ